MPESCLSSRKQSNCQWNILPCVKDGCHVKFKQAQKIAWGKAEDGYVSLSFEPLNIHAVGENRKETIQDFWDELVFVWRNYALADDSELTQDAIELKHRAQEYLAEE